MTQSNILQIDTTFLKGILGEVQQVLSQVTADMSGAGYQIPATSGITVVNGSLQVSAGASFPAAAELNQALMSMGSSVYAQLQWLQKVLTDMVSETEATIKSMTGTESLNEDSVDQLQQDFYQTIADMQSPPGGGSSGGGSSGGGSSGSGSSGGDSGGDSGGKG
jgi:hypothetical protein